MNINTKEYWDKTYLEDDGIRDYEKTFEYICLELKPEDSVIEFGCGKGILGKRIIEQGNQYVGFDLSEVAVKEAEKNGVNVAVFDILKNAINVKRDVVIATEFLEHFTDEELKTVMQKILKVADRGIFSVPDDCLGKEEWKEHYQKWNKDSLKQFLKQYYTEVIVFSHRNIRFKHPSLLAICRGKKQ